MSTEPTDENPAYPGGEERYLMETAKPAILEQIEQAAVELAERVRVIDPRAGADFGALADMTPEALAALLAGLRAANATLDQAGVTA